MRRVQAIGLALLGGLITACTTTVTTSSGEVISKPGDRTGARAGEADARTRARARVELAAGYYRNGQLGIALEEARRATAIDPGFAGAYGLLGLIYMEMGERREAEENFLRGLKLDPASSELANNFGWFLCQSGRERESLEYFGRAIRDPLYATPAKANLNAGTCLMRVKDYAAAEPYLRRSFELDATNPTTKYQLTRLYLAMGQTERASFYYGILSKSVESSAETLWLGLRIARARGDLRTETQMANELRERFPRSAEADALARGSFDE